MKSLKTVDMKRSIRKTLTFDRTSAVGLGLLLTSSFMGALLRNSAQITNDPLGRMFRSTCDTYVRGLCIPTAYFSIPAGPLGSLVINLTSFAVSAVFFVLGVVLVRR